ncbi:mannosyltransferase [Iningainema tapete]|uniref:Mannosyltransferase n=1 Tax=Iningainema tapete BLCC-T55 TaxID=2748662 RepID=A0A8J6XMZ7_9CYAN|nr:mannosyltransferase [Iningainema tapete]MBD2774910.1 mannosyltransferase [Iningainema tapete BLCC-T55]
MTKKRIIITAIPLIICGAFILCAAVGMLISPEAFHKFFSPIRLSTEIPAVLSQSYYWDVELYAYKAINPICDAFYPLWPLIIRTLFHPQTIEQAAHYFVIVATILFFISTFLLFWVFKKGLERINLAFLLVLAYTVNPMAIFRVIGYTESLFATLSTLLIWICLPQSKLNQNLKLLLIFPITFLMALTRPVLIQILFSSTAALATIFIFEILQSKTFANTPPPPPLPTQSLLPTPPRGGLGVGGFNSDLKTTLTIWISSILGYSLYGSFCLKTRGNFFAPFLDQKSWSKKFGLHVELLFYPKSLFFDLLGLYLPLIILCLSLTFIYFKIIQREPYIYKPKSIFWSILFLYPPLLIILYAFQFIKRQKLKLDKLITSDYTYSLSKNYIFWFCVYFAAIHSIIVIFTQDRLYSLARFIFALPYFFLAVGYIYRCILDATKYKTLLLFIVISAITLVKQWINYGQDKWLG